MKITVIGSGIVGRTVAAGFAAGSHHVTLSSRSPAELSDWSLTSGVSVKSPPDSTEDADIIVNATPGQASIEALSAVSPAGDVIILDIGNPLDFSTGSPRLFTGVDESLAESIQAAFPEARVVKSLNTVNAGVMINPVGLAEATAQFVCGNDSGAKAVVVDLLTGLGWQPDQILDLGDLTAARETERYLLLWLRLMTAAGTASFNIRLVKD